LLDQCPGVVEAVGGDFQLGAEFDAAVRANDSKAQTPLEFRPYGAEG
jgi:hypothetical protein